MNSFPVIFSRGRGANQLTQIRSLFIHQSSHSPFSQLEPQTSKIVLRPKETVKLKRPATARAQPARSMLSTRSVERTRTKGIRRIQASPIPAPIPLRTTPLPLDRDSSRLSTHHHLNRSRSSEFLEAAAPAGRTTQESEMWTVSNSDTSPNQPVADLSPFQTFSPARRPSPPRLKEGEAALPSQFVTSHYLMKLFAAPLKVNETRAALLSHIASELQVHIAESSTTRIAHSEKDVYVVVTGQHAPLSPCCNAAVIFTYSREGGGKVVCSASYCPSRTVSNFHIPTSLKSQLWTESTRVSMSSRELSTHVRKGSYKTMSLRREMDKRSLNAETRLRTQQLLTAKPIFTNEKLKFVSPVKPAATHLPTDLQIDTLTPLSTGVSTVMSNPLLRLLQRSNSRHNSVRRQCTTDEILSQLSNLLHLV